MVYACQALDLTKQEAGAAAPLGNGGNSVKIGALKEIFDGENRVAMTPDSALQLVKLGHSCCIEAGAGAKAGFSDALYAAAGVEVLKNAKAVTEAADVLVKVRGPEEKEAKLLREGQTLISFFWPAQNEALLKLVAERGATVVAMDMVPRISRAQKMDALSSMANIAGYRAVIEAGNNFGRFFTGQVTAAGKVPPAKVLIVGAGVAGLAAIGTSVSLGAIVHAFDVRPEVAEQIESMGASFVYLEFDASELPDGAATGGYAAPSSPAFAAKQLAKFRELAPEMDIVITTALIPGRAAPRLITDAQIATMKPGSVIYDLAVAQGGNVEGSVADQVTEKHGVKIIGYSNTPATLPADASALYARNLFNFLSAFWDKEAGKPILDEEIGDAVRLTRGGQIVNDRLRPDPT